MSGVCRRLKRVLEVLPESSVRWVRSSSQIVKVVKVVKRLKMVVQIMKGMDTSCWLL